MSTSSRTPPTLPNLRAAETVLSYSPYGAVGLPTVHTMPTMDREEARSARFQTGFPFRGILPGPRGLDTNPKGSRPARPASSRLRQPLACVNPAWGQMFSIGVPLHKSRKGETPLKPLRGAAMRGRCYESLKGVMIRPYGQGGISPREELGSHGISHETMRTMG